MTWLAVEIELLISDAQHHVEPSPIARMVAAVAIGISLRPERGLSGLPVWRPVGGRFARCVNGAGIDTYVVSGGCKV